MSVVEVKEHFAIGVANLDLHGGVEFTDERMLLGGEEDVRFATEVFHDFHVGDTLVVVNGAVEGGRIVDIRITSYNVCYTKLLRV